jgi:DNA invertase Pin-like site-specific DNA recombinase
MERKITITPAATPLPKRTRVAAYARVSLGTDHMLHSLSAQVSHYSKYIQSRSDWEYAGVYADFDQTGTKDSRPEFQRMLDTCRAGEIDKVITKSISRFARNTVTLLETVRELKDLGIGVWFEEQNIDTLSGDGELMMTIIAGFAQEESRSVSENIKWRKRNDMKSGKTKPVKVYGYRSENGRLIIEPTQAEVVRTIFTDYLNGMGQALIAKKLNEQGITTAGGYKWSSGTIRGILINPKMCGNLLHQRTYTTDHLTKAQITNRGELPMFLIEGTHEGIVSVETWETVQAELVRRGGIGGLHESEGVVLRKKIVCAECGRKFCHTTSGHGESKCRAWLCGGRDKRTGENCTNRQIPEPPLMEALTEALGNSDFACIESILAYHDRHLTITLADGRIIETQWKRRKTVPYSKIGIEKRTGRNICYSKCGKGNMSERRRKKLEKEAEQNATSTSHSGEEA